MLDPNDRSLLTSLLTPPLGLVFDKGIATTYSLDPLSLLGVPVHLAWMANRDDASILQDPIRLLESLQRVAKRLTVFADRGRIAVPGNGNPLFSMLESTIAEVRAPGGGAFHPKLWLLRFADPSNQRPAQLRLGVLSRNLTSDRRWDLSLVLEGEVQRAIHGHEERGQDRIPQWQVELREDGFEFAGASIGGARHPDGGANLCQPWRALVPRRGEGRREFCH